MVEVSGKTFLKYNNLTDEKYDPANGKPLLIRMLVYSSCKQCPVIDSDWEILPVFRSLQSFSEDAVLILTLLPVIWLESRVFVDLLPARVTAAAIAWKRSPRDPLHASVLPYHMGDYFAHWIKIVKTAPDKNNCKIFNVTVRKNPMVNSMPDMA